MRCASRLAIMAAQGRDVKLDPARIAGYRNFGTKLWNATRFAEMNGVARNDEFWFARRQAHDQPLDPDRADACGPRGHRGARGLPLQRCGGGGLSLRLEPVLRLVSGTAQAGVHGRGRARPRPKARRCAAFVLDEIYKLLHPFMPFMTEELWGRTAGGAGERPTCSAMPHGRRRSSRTPAQPPRSTG